MSNTTSRSTVVWQTVAAVVIGATTFAAALFLANAVVILAEYAPSDEGTSPLSMDLVRAVLPSVAGVGAARYVCDLFLRHYAKRIVFCFFAMFSYPVFIMAFRSGGHPWDHLLAFLSAASLLLVAFAMFWRADSRVSPVTPTVV